jgi:hypothetical protein
MPFVITDWSLTRSSGNLRYIGDDHGGASPSYCTTIELHRGLQALAGDQTSTGDDQVDITDPTPSSRLGIDNIVELLNGVNIDDASSEHIYDGSIIQSNGDTIYEGFVNYGGASQIQIIQNGAVLADDWWNSNGGLNADSANNISHRFMLKVRDAGSDIDGRRIIATSRVFGETPHEFVVNGTARGNNTLALDPSDDPFNNTAAGTVATWTDVTNTEGYRSIDVTGDGSTEAYYSEWDKGSRTINQMMERMKWLTRDGSSSTLYGLPGELFRGITHQWNYDNEGSGPFTEPEALSWSGGTGQLLAIDDNGSTGTMWIQLLTGVAPSDGDTITGGTSSATCDVDGSVTSRTVSTPFFGSSTGTAIIGAFGLGIQASDLSANDSVIDLGNSTNQPPNNVTFTVNGTTNAVGYLIVGPWDGSSVDINGDPETDYDQMTLQSNQTGAAVTSLQMSASIPTDTPSSGSIRVTLNNGRRRYVSYTSYTGDTFAISSTDFSAESANAGNGVFVSYIDKVPSGTSESFTSVYNSDRQLVVKHRNGASGSPEKEFISSSTLGSSGGSINLIRASDA